MTNIVLTCLSPFENRGVEALALSIVDGLRETFDNPHLTVLARDHEMAKRSLDPRGVTTLPDPAFAPHRGASIRKKIRFRTRRFVRRKLLGRLHPAERAIAAADLVVVSGGDVFSSVYGTMERFIRQLDQPLAAGIPVLFLGQSVGPFDNDTERNSFIRTARRCRFTVREEISFDYLTRELELPEDIVTLTADPAFRLHVDEETKRRVLTTYGLEPGTYAAFALSRGIAKFRGLEADAHLQACIEATKTLIELAGRAVLVPHVQPSYSEAQNDRLLAEEVHAALDHDPRCVVMNHAFHTSIEFKAALSQASLPWPSVLTAQSEPCPHTCPPYRSVTRSRPKACCANLCKTKIS